MIESSRALTALNRSFSATDVTASGAKKTLTAFATRVKLFKFSFGVNLNTLVAHTFSPDNKSFPKD